MNEVNELTGICTYIMNRLNASAGIVAAVGDRIHFAKIPKGSAYPAIVFTFLTSLDKQTVAGERIFTTPIFHVKAVDTSDDPANAMAIATLIDQALNKAPGANPVSGLHVIGGYRTQIIFIPEVIQDVTFYHVGGEYRFVIHNT